jgi:hypothetical protein
MKGGARETWVGPGPPRKVGNTVSRICPPKNGVKNRGSRSLPEYGFKNRGFKKRFFPELVSILWYQNRVFNCRFHLVNQGLGVLSGVSAGADSCVAGP